MKHSSFLGTSSQDRFPMLLRRLQFLHILKYQNIRLGGCELAQEKDFHWQHCQYSLLVEFQFEQTWKTCYIQRSSIKRQGMTCNQLRWPHCIKLSDGWGEKRPELPGLTVFSSQGFWSYLNLKVEDSSQQPPLTFLSSILAASFVHFFDVFDEVWFAGVKPQRQALQPHVGPAGLAFLHFDTFAANKFPPDVLSEFVWIMQSY